jgi:predicted flap endonuclease-1-like 5' DNA nuclease
MNDTDSELPKIIGRPALRALSAAGIYTIQQVAKLSDQDLLALHGVGPKAIRILRENTYQV